MRPGAFSVTNTPQYDLATVDMTSGNFGRITGTIGGNRTVKLGGKLTF